MSSSHSLNIDKWVTAERCHCDIVILNLFLDLMLHYKFWKYVNRNTGDVKYEASIQKEVRLMFLGSFIHLFIKNHSLYLLLHLF